MLIEIKLDKSEEVKFLKMLNSGFISFENFKIVLHLTYKDNV